MRRPTRDHHRPKRVALNRLVLSLRIPLVDPFAPRVRGISVPPASTTRSAITIASAITARAKRSIGLAFACVLVACAPGSANPAAGAPNNARDPAPETRVSSTPGTASASAAATVAAGSVIPPSANALLVFDAHVHYNREAWAAYPPERILEILAGSGVQRALVSSTPDEGTLRLHALAPRVVVPLLRPYRGPADASGWARDGTIVPYVEASYRRGVHRGIGEIHLYPGESELPTVRTIFGIAVREGLVLQIHADDRAIDEAMRAGASATRVLWAHAGQTASPETIARLVERYPSMSVELSGRLDVAPDGTLDPEWRELLVRHPDRFLVGTDTWVNAQWDAMPDLRARDRAWLAQLPTDAATLIARGNAERLFPMP